MLVKTDDIPDEGLRLEETYSQGGLDEALTEGRGTGFRAAADFGVAASFTKVGGGGVLVEGKLTPAVVAPCKRCLSEVQLELPVRFTLSFVPRAALREEPDEDADDRGEVAGSFVAADVDEEPFDGHQIDLDPIVREQVLLALPVSVVCKDDCRGLCTVCGQDLNEKPCGCEPKIQDPRLAVLKNFKLN